jgi:hypothetical protein
MPQTTILEESYDQFNVETGEVKSQIRRTIKKGHIEPEDEYFKVSRYLNTIFSYNNIPLNLVPISLLIAQEMEFKTNRIYLLKPLKLEFAEMLNLSLDRVNKLIKDCVRYDIIRPIARGTYEVNSYLYSTGTMVETRELQAHFDFCDGSFATRATQKNLINGEVVRKAVHNRKEKKYQIPGQMTLPGVEEEEL